MRWPMSRARRSRRAFGPTRRPPSICRQRRCPRSGSSRAAPTFAQTPAAMARRPGTETALANLDLAGDWTATGLPATIEGAVRSGQRAAERAARPAP